MIKALLLHAAETQGQVLALDEPLSFWGAFDPRTGVILDIHHPQRGACLTGRVVLMAETRGSGSAPGAIAEAIRRGTAPAAIVLVKSDINLMIGAEVAAELYGRHCAIVCVSTDDFARLRAREHLAISADGTIT
jgi:predicted aconitase with swiveling domain